MANNRQGEDGQKRAGAALHEAGHFIVGLIVGARIKSISIDAGNPGAGMTLEDGKWFDCDDEWAPENYFKYRFRECLIILAGPVGELVMTNGNVCATNIIARKAFRSDWEKFSEILVEIKRFLTITGSTQEIVDAVFVPVLQEIFDKSEVKDIAVYIGCIANGKTVNADSIHNKLKETYPKYRDTLGNILPLINNACVNSYNNYTPPVPYWLLLK